MDSTLVAILVIATFGLLTVGAIAATVYSFYQQRVYDNTTLPALYPVDDKPKQPVIADDDDPNEPVRFELDDDDAFVLEDSESNELMRSIEKAAGIAPKTAPKLKKEKPSKEAEPKSAEPKSRPEKKPKESKSIFNFGKKTPKPEVEPVVTPPDDAPVTPISLAPKPVSPFAKKPATPDAQASPFPLATPNEGGNRADA